LITPLLLHRFCKSDAKIRGFLLNQAKVYTLFTRIKFKKAGVGSKTKRKEGFRIGGTFFPETRGLFGDNILDL
jgi:hypothetical protein